MKIKAIPEDFIVEEILGAPIRAHGAFALYLLRKRNENTIDVLKCISRNLKVPLQDLSYGGRKDRHSLASQYIAVKGRRKLEEKGGEAKIKGRNYTLEFAGFLDRPMGPDLIQGNRFAVTVRSLADGPLQEALAEILKVREWGYPNYFDDQRFGSFDARLGFFAEKILKRHFNGALKNYLTHASSQDRKEDRERKDFFYKHWGQWPDCRKIAKTTFEKLSFSRLTEKPKDFISVLRKIPREEVSLFFSAYQAYLWNEVLRRTLLSRVKGPLAASKGAVGDYLFYRTLEPREFLYWQKLTIPTAASKMAHADGDVEKFTEEFFRENEIERPMFNITKIRQAYFKSTQRNAIVLPQGLACESQDDEMHAGRKKLILKFTLPTGSFATMLIKRIF